MWAVVSQLVISVYLASIIYLVHEVDVLIFLFSSPLRGIWWHWSCHTGWLPSAPARDMVCTKSETFICCCYQCIIFTSSIHLLFLLSFNTFATLQTYKCSVWTTITVRFLSILFCHSDYMMQWRKSALLNKDCPWITRVLTVSWLNDSWIYFLISLLVNN